MSHPYAYTSREWEQETGDYYYRARYFDSRAERFLSEDPIGFNSGDYNLYRYVFNNPILNKDPTGKLAAEGALVLIVCGGVAYMIADKAAEIKASNQCQARNEGTEQRCTESAKERSLPGNIGYIYGQ